jgi:hypothetical protein
MIEFASKVPVHKRWIETVVIQIYGLNIGVSSKVPVHKRWIETLR